MEDGTVSKVVEEPVGVCGLIFLRSIFLRFVYFKRSELLKEEIIWLK